MSRLFKRPFSKEIFGNDKTTNYTYPKSELLRDDIFPYLVLDGGASQLLLDRFGSNKGEDILRLSMSGELFLEFQNGEEYNWERSFAYTFGTDFTPKYEWQIWPQRLYMTIPIAHAFLKTGDRKYSDKWLEIVRGWYMAHPYQPFDPNIHYLKTDMVWRDMQVAWRTMSLLHGVFMLQDAPYGIKEWKYIYDFIALHTHHLYEEAIDRINRGLAQNHVLQIGVVLIMAAVMFPELENSDELLKIGTNTVKMNMRAIFPDGASNEDSPSYSHFIARLYLEAYMLLKHNNKEIPDGLFDFIVRQYEWLHQFSTPTGEVVRFSDTYGMNAQSDIERAERLLQLRIQNRKESRFFPESKTAVIRAHDFTLFADAMDYTGGHQHAGRPQIELYYKDEPIFVDAGCCSYDRWEFYMNLRNMRMHNVLYSPDFEYRDGQINMTIGLADFDANGKITLLATVRERETEYTWTRRIEVSEKLVKITDTANASKPIEWAGRLFTTRADVHTIDSNTVERMTEKTITSFHSLAGFATELLPVMNADNRIDYSICLCTHGNGFEYKNEITISVKEK